MEQQYLNELRQTHMRRLRVLELQAAHYGSDVPPHILIEVEDIRAKIRSIDDLIANLPSASLTPSINPVVKSGFPGKCPYKGLQAFQEEDSGYFFGREALIARLVSLLQSSISRLEDFTEAKSRFLAVV